MQGLASAHGERGVVWSCSVDGTRIWDAWQRTCRASVERCVDVHSCISSTDGVNEYIWTGHGNGVVHKWESRRAELLLVLPPVEMSSRIPGVARSLVRKPTVRCLVALSEFGDIWVGGTDGHIHVYEIATGALKRSWLAHHSSITAMCVVQCSGLDSLKVCTASQRGAHVRVWHADLSQQETTQPTAAGQEAAEGAGGVAGGAAGLLRSVTKKVERQKFNFYAAPEQPLADSVALFDHFIVCGKRDLSSDPAAWVLESIGEGGNRGNAGSPEILWHVPAVDGQRLNLPKIEDFCFPMPVGLEDGPRKWLGVPDTPLEDMEPFAFLLTSSPDGGTPFTLYCCCRYVMPPGAADETDPEPLCFCLISRYPFFSLHFHVLELLANAHQSGDASADAGNMSAAPGVASMLNSPPAARYGGGFFEEEGSGLLSSPVSANGADDLISFFANSPQPALPPPPVAGTSRMDDDDPFMMLATRDSTLILPPAVALPSGEASPPALAAPAPAAAPDFVVTEGGVRVLEAYKATVPPARGVTTTVALAEGLLPPCSFSRPRRDEECSGRLGLVSTFRSLSVHNFLLFFSCTLLERQVVVTADAVAGLADAVLTMPSLLRPYFEWHSMLMPSEFPLSPATRFDLH